MWASPHRLPEYPHSRASPIASDPREYTPKTEAFLQPDLASDSHHCHTPFVKSSPHFKGRKMKLYLFEGSIKEFVDIFKKPPCYDTSCLYLVYSLVSGKGEHIFSVKDQIVKYYFRHCGPECLYCKIAIIYTWLSVALFKSDFIYNNKKKGVGQIWPQAGLVDTWSTAIEVIGSLVYEMILFPCHRNSISKEIRP